MDKRRVLAGILAWVLVLTSLTWPAGIFEVTTAEAADEITYADSITIYGMDSKYEEVLSIPTDYALSYQIEDEDAISYFVYKGNAVTVSEDGLIEAGYAYSYSSSGERATSLLGGEAVVEVTTYTDVYYIYVTVVDYTDVYVDSVIEEFISENITSDMTDMELMRAICSFPASYDYNTSYSSAKGMILYGGGTCWASTDLIVETCEKLGITAWWRDGSKDSGSGSAHVNAMVEYNGSYYELEAGYSGTAPRSYYVKERTSLFSYTYTNGIEVYQYDGYVTEPYELEIPETIYGTNVVSIGDKFASSDSYLAKIILPDTITNIGEFAFRRCTALTSVNIPASVTSIGTGAFQGCSSLSDFTCDEDNEYYTIDNGVLYDKDMVNIYAVPYVSSINFTDTTETIADYAVCGNINITEITIPSTITYIGSHAFANCTNLQSVTFEQGDELEIGDYAFYYSGLTEVEIPSTVTSIGECAFYITDLVNVYIPSSVTYIGTKAFAINDSLKNVIIESGETLEIGDYAFYLDSNIESIEIPTSVTSIGDYAFDGCRSITDVYYQGTEEEWNKIDIGTNNTYLTSATIHYNTSRPASDTLSVSAEKSTITVGETVQITPEGFGSFSYSSSDESVAIVSDTGVVTGTGVGSVDITVYASGNEYVGSASASVSLTVRKGYQSISVNIDNSELKVNETAQITARGNGDITYYSFDKSVATVSDTGLITAVGVGETTIRVYAAGNSNYYSSSEDVSVSVVKADQTISVSIGNSIIALGETSQITASGSGTVTYSSSNTSVATVSSTGLVTAVGVGTANITITASGNDDYNSATKTISVTVEEKSAGVDTDAEIDTGADTDIGTDTDAGTYTETDTGIDIDVEADASTSQETDVNDIGVDTETATNTGQETDISASTGTSTDASTSTETDRTDTSATTGTNTDASTSTDGKSDTSTSTGTGTDISTGTNTSTSSGTYTDTGVGTDTDANTDTDADIDSTPDYTLGDINDDGFIDYLDALLALRHDAELISLSDVQVLAGDVNKDGSVDALDAILILRFDAGLIENF